jgi:hypothetical protein
MTLPYELREQILFSVVQARGTIQLQYPIWGDKSVFVLPVAQVCNDLREEVFQVFYRANVFVWLIDPEAVRDWGARVCRLQLAECWSLLLERPQRCIRGVCFVWQLSNIDTGSTSGSHDISSRVRRGQRKRLWPAGAACLQSTLAILSYAVKSQALETQSISPTAA